MRKYTKAAAGAAIKKQAEKKFYVFLSPPVMNDIFD